MKITSYAVARPAYYDRGAVSTFLSASGSFTNHSSTTRWTTTVAAGKKLLVEQGEAFTLTVVAAATPLRLAAKCTVTDGTYLTSFASVDIQQSASLNACNENITYPAITVYAGEIAYGSTFLNSATGTVFMFVGMKGTTYNA